MSENISSQELEISVTDFTAISLTYALIDEYSVILFPHSI
jgi:hypothetical protein